MLDISKAEALRDPAQLQRLIEAVVAAGDHDESRSVEWKSSLDLASPEAAFSIARTVLGLANRHPDHAAAEFRGVGYMIIGAEPASLAGLSATIDMVDLANKLSPYFGMGSPQWAPQHITVEGKDVLVIVVEPPKWGDRMWVTRKTYSSGKTTVEAGAVFVRGPAKTARATPDELDMLQERLSRRAEAPADLKLMISPTGGAFARLDASWSNRAIWLDERRNIMQRAIFKTQGKRDMRWAALPSVTDEQLQRIVDSHIREVARVLNEVGYARCVRSARPVAVRLKNPTDKNLPDVRLTLHLRRGTGPKFVADGEEEWVDTLPQVRDLASIYAPLPLAAGISGESRWRTPIRTGVTFERLSNHDLDIILDVGDIRPRAAVTSPWFYAFGDLASGAEMEVPCTITSKGVDAVQEATVVFPVDADPVALSSLVPVEEGLGTWAAEAGHGRSSQNNLGARGGTTLGPLPCSSDDQVPPKVAVALIGWRRAGFPYAKHPDKSPAARRAFPLRCSYRRAAVAALLSPAPMDQGPRCARPTARVLASLRAAPPHLASSSSQARRSHRLGGPW